MKVLLINPPDYGAIDPEMDPPFNLLMLASVLEKSHNIEVDIAEWALGMPQQIPYTDIYGVSLTTPTYNSARMVAAQIRTVYPESKIVVGGSHAQFMPVDFADTVFRGNCLRDLSDLLLKPGYHYCSGHISNCYPICFDKIDLQKYINKRFIPDCTRTMSFLGTIGCNFKCAFCYNAYFGNHLQSFASTEMQQIIRTFVESYKIDGINFLDDNFLLFPKVWRNQEIPWRGAGSIALLKAIKPIELVDANCRMLYIGVESGSNMILSAMNKAQTTNDINTVVDRLQDVGIRCRGSFIVGFPGETWETIDETAKLIEKFDNVTIHLFVVYPGSDVFFHPDKYGIVWISSNFDDYRSHPDKYGNLVPTFETATLDCKTLLEMHSYLGNVKPGVSL